jgi:hypothetical protein
MGIAGDRRFGHTELISELEPGADPVSLSAGPGGAVVYVELASDSVIKVDADGYRREIVRAGDGDSESDGAWRIGIPTLATRGGDDVVIVDDGGLAWSWRERDGAGYLAPREITQDTKQYELLGPALIAAGSPGLASVTNGTRAYEIFSVDPSGASILHHVTTRHDTGFTPATEIT